MRNLERVDNEQDYGNAWALATMTVERYAELGIGGSAHVTGSFRKGNSHDGSDYDIAFVTPMMNEAERHRLSIQSKLEKEPEANRPVHLQVFPPDFDFEMGE